MRRTTRGPRCNDTPDEALVVGGGLASIDVVKVLQLENYERALRARGIETDMHELEKGIPRRVQSARRRSPKDLGVKGCLLIYRRRMQDMPLAQPPDNATPDQIAKTEQVRPLKMLQPWQEDRYLFRIQGRRVVYRVCSPKMGKPRGAEEWWKRKLKGARPNRFPASSTTARAAGHFFRRLGARK